MLVEWLGLVRRGGRNGHVTGATLGCGGLSIGGQMGVTLGFVVVGGVGDIFSGLSETI